MSKEDQVSITYYAQSLVQGARQEPNKYIMISVKYPEFISTYEKIQNLCDECWGIGVGGLAPANQVLMDKIIVQGDIPWEKDDKCCRGSKGSVFRGETSK